MPNNKASGNDGIAKEFYEVFWNDLKLLLFLSIINVCRVRGYKSLTKMTNYNLETDVSAQR